MNNFNDQLTNNVSQQDNQNQKKSNGLGIASLVLGISSIITCCFYGVPLIPAIIGLVFGIIQMKKYKNGIAIAGVVTSIFGILFNTFEILNLVLTIQQYGGLDGYLEYISNEINQGNI